MSDQYSAIQYTVRRIIPACASSSAAAGRFGFCDFDWLFFADFRRASGARPGELCPASCDCLGSSFPNPRQLRQLLLQLERLEQVSHFLHPLEDLLRLEHQQAASFFFSMCSTSSHFTGVETVGCSRARSE